jgi:hypothetical protein
MVSQRLRSFAVLALAVSLAGCSGSGDSSTGGRTGFTGGAGGSSRPGFPTGPGGGLAGSGLAPTIPLAGSGSTPTGGAIPVNPTKPDDVCEVVHLTADPQTPDMMIVLDRSGSMTDGGRWTPSVSAVRRVTLGLETQIRFGLSLFPDPKSTDAAGLVTSIADCISAADPQMCIDKLTNSISNAQAGVCAPGVVAVPIAEKNAMAIGSALDKTLPSGGTPTSGTLEMLLNTFANAPAGPDSMGVHAKYILLVTDGQPTCPNGQGQNTTQPDIDAANKAIETLLAKDVKTYVIGYDTTGAGNEQLAKVLDGFAQRGGTGDKMHRPVEDEASLLTEFQKITGAIVGCAFTLDKAPSRADFVRVTLDGKQVNLDDPNGWKLTGDRTVELIGSACDAF